MSGAPSAAKPGGQPSNEERLEFIREFWSHFGALPDALGVEVVAWEADRAEIQSSGPALCRQVGSRVWIGEVFETLAALAAGLLATEPGSAPRTISAPLAVTVRTIHHLRPSTSDHVTAEARWIRRGRSESVVETIVRDAEGKELVRALSQHAAIAEAMEWGLAGEETLPR